MSDESLGDQPCALQHGVAVGLTVVAVTELQAALELMHTASRRFHTIDAKLRQLSHRRPRHDIEDGRGQGQWEGRQGAVQGFTVGPPSETVSRLCIAQPGRGRMDQVTYQDGRAVQMKRVVVDGEQWWTFHSGSGSRTSDGDPEIPDYGATRTGFERFLDPSALGVGVDLACVGHVTIAGRSALRLRGAPTPEWRYERGGVLVSGPTPPPFGTAYDFAVDAERGVVLRLATLVDDEVMSSTEFLEVVFDKDLLPQVFVFVPPDREPARSVPAPQSVTIEQAQRLAPFTVLIPPSVPDGATIHVSYTPDSGRPWSGATVSMTYSFRDTTPTIWITESAVPGCWPGDAEWEAMERSGQQLFVWKDDSPESWIQLNQDGTSVRIQSGLPRDLLLEMAASLVPAPTEEPPLTARP